jgi:hypothetical protein
VDLLEELRRRNTLNYDQQEINDTVVRENTTLLFDAENQLIHILINRGFFQVTFSRFHKDAFILLVHVTHRCTSISCSEEWCNEGDNAVYLEVCSPVRYAKSYISTDAFVILKSFLENFRVQHPKRMKDLLGALELEEYL